MFYELALIPFFLVVFLFVIFWIVAEGTRWQKHRYLGAFARFIQVSAFRSFLIFLLLLFTMIPVCLLVLTGFWYDGWLVHENFSTTVPIVDTLLVILTLGSPMLAVVWSHFRKWRQAVRSASETKVRALT
jgi:hypothetical protein